MTVEDDKLVLQMMKDYPLEPGQALFFGPKSVAYVTGDYIKAPWLLDGFKPPGGKRLPDKFVLEESEWRPSPK